MEKLSGNDWKRIEVKYSGQCITCNGWIMKGEQALWLFGLGLKHIECPTGIIEDNSALVIIDEEDKVLLGYDRM